MMRILHFSDLHLDTPFSSSYLSQRVAKGCRLRLRRTLLRLMALAAEHEVNAVTIGGDLFEGDRVSRDTLQFISKCFSQIAPIPVIIAPGNHDYYSPVSPYARFDWPANTFIFHTNQVKPLNLSDSITIWGFAHTMPNIKKNPLANFRAPQNERVHLLLLHGSANGATDEKRGHYAPFPPQAIRDAQFDFALLGHYHTGRLLGEREKMGAYPGSPQPLAFGENGEHGAILLRIDHKKIEVERLPTASQAFHLLEYTPPPGTHDTHTLGESILSAISQRASEANFLRLILKGLPDEPLDFQQDLLQAQLTEYFEAVQIINELRPAAALDELAREPTVRGAYVRRLQRMLAEDHDEPELIRLALKYGIDAFESENEGAK